MTMSYIAGLTLAVTLTPCQYDSSSNPIQSAAPYGLQQAGKQIPVNNKNQSVDLLTEIS